MDAVRISCYRVSSGYAGMSSADLVTAITAPYCLRRMELVEFFGLLTAAGAVVAEIAPLYQFDLFVSHLEYQLRHPEGQTGTGNYAAVGMFVTMAQNLTTMSTATLTAIQTVLAVSALRLVDVVAAELGEAAPETVSEAEVAEALGR